MMSMSSVPRTARSLLLSLPLLPSLSLALALILSLTTHIHRIIRTLSEPVLCLSVVGDDRAEDGARVVLGDATDDDAVGAGRLAVVDAGLLDGELEVGLLGVGEGEMLVVVVSVGVWRRGS